MKRAPFILIIILIIAGWYFYPGSNELPSSDQPTEQSGTLDGIPTRPSLQALHDGSVATLVQEDYIVTGGPWGLLVGKKSDTSFEQLLTGNPVRAIELSEGILIYEEQETDGTWSLKSINLTALEMLLQSTK